MQVPLSKLRAHNRTCTDQVEGATAAWPPVYRPPNGVSGRDPSNQENRLTFPCPYCETDNLDLVALRDHCNADHNNSSQSVVCSHLYFSHRRHLWTWCYPAAWVNLP